MSIGAFLPIVLIITIFVVKKKNNILLTTIFFAPFTTSAVLIVSEKVLQPGHYFLFMYIVVLVLQSRGVIHLRKPNKWLTIFIISAFSSIIIAWVRGTNVQVYGIGNGVELKSSLVSSQNFTQYIYLFCGFLLYCFIKDYCSESRENWEKVIRVCAYSEVAILIIALYQMIANLTGLPFDSIFRNPYTTWNQTGRLQAVFNEASYFGQHSVLMIPCVIYTFKNRKSLCGIILAVLLITNAVARSSTFFVGLFVLIIVYGVVQKKYVSAVLKYLTYVLILMFAAYVGYMYNPTIAAWFDSAISKFTLEGISGIERVSVITYMFAIWLKYPVFGIGYGGGRSLDMYTNILSTTGLAGFFPFIACVASWLANFFKSHRGNSDILRILLVCVFLAMGISMCDLTMLNVWVVFAIVDSHVTSYKLTNIGTCV